MIIFSAQVPLHFSLDIWIAITKKDKLLLHKTIEEKTWEERRLVSQVNLIRLGLEQINGIEVLKMVTAATLKSNKATTNKS